MSLSHMTKGSVGTYDTPHSGMFILCSQITQKGTVSLYHVVTMRSFQPSVTLGVERTSLDDPWTPCSLVGGQAAHTREVRNPHWDHAACIGSCSATRRDQTMPLRFKELLWRCDEHSALCSCITDHPKMASAFPCSPLEALWSWPFSPRGISRRFFFIFTSYCPRTSFPVMCSSLHQLPWCLSHKSITGAHMAPRWNL